MRLSTKSRYAVTSLLDLVMHSDQGPVSLADISVRQGISLSYLEQLFAKMRRNKLVVSTRGPGGGYSLGSPPEQVCIADVINAVDEEVQVADKDIARSSANSIGGRKPNKPLFNFGYGWKYRSGNAINKLFLWQ